MNSLSDLLKHYKEMALLKSTHDILQWDMETTMPKGAADLRSEQLEVVSKLRHRLVTDKKFIDALLNFNEKSLSPGSTEQRQFYRLKKEVLKANAISEEFVARQTRAQVSAHHKWIEARKEKNFSLVQKELEELVLLAREEADSLRENSALQAYYKGRSRYEVQLDSYEPGMAAGEIRTLLAELVKGTKQLLPEILEKAQSYKANSTAFALSEEKQKILGEKIASAMGLDFSRARLDTSAHPFCTDTYGDVRITTRYDMKDFTESLLGVIHESGHALYRQNIPAALFHTPGGQAASSGIDESQSRFMENTIARSRAFSRYLSKETGIPADDIFRKLNHVEKTFIRTEADEVTYNLHIQLRFSLEEPLLEGKIAVKDLPELWNEKFAEIFGLKVPDISVGVLQDIHWFMGAYGYFPTYSLGNLFAAELFQDLQKENADWETQVEQGEFSPIVDFLRQHVHHNGALMESPETIRCAIGRPLSANSFLQYISNKYLKN